MAGRGGSWLVPPRKRGSKGKPDTTTSKSFEEARVSSPTCSPPSSRTREGASPAPSRRGHCLPTLLQPPPPPPPPPPLPPEGAAEPAQKRSGPCFGKRGCSFRGILEGKRRGVTAIQFIPTLHKTPSSASQTPKKVL